MIRETANPIDPLLQRAPDAIADPYPIYDRQREIEPVLWHEGAQTWILTSFDDVAGALGDPQVFSSERIPLLLQQLQESGAGEGLDPEVLSPLINIFSSTLLMTDPPEHTRLRQASDQAFTRDVIDSIGYSVRNTASILLDPVRKQGSLEVMEQFARPLPAEAIAELFGVPQDEREKFKRLSDDLASAFPGNSRIVVENIPRALQGAQELGGYFQGLFARPQRAPLVAALLQAEANGSLAREELVAMCLMAVLAAHDTTAYLIGNGLLALLHHPEQMQLLKDSPDLIGPAVEEMIRCVGPVQSTRRIATETVKVRDKTIAPQQSVSLILGAANRDPARFTDPDQLMITRKDAGHLGFGTGIHSCLGAYLARVEAQIAFQSLLELGPELRLEAEPQVSDWHPNDVFRGLKHLHIAF